MASLEQLYNLIQTMHRSEKRFFKMEAQKNKRTQTTQYTVLFNILDKSTQFDKGKLIRLIEKELPKKNISKLKSVLKENLFTSLYLFSKGKHDVTEQFDRISIAKILIKRSQYNLAKKELLDYKAEAIKNDLITLVLLINNELGYVLKRQGEMNPIFIKEVSDLYDESAYYNQLLSTEIKLKQISIKCIATLHAEESIIEVIHAKFDKILEEELFPLKDQLVLASLKMRYYGILSYVYNSKKDLVKTAEVLESMKELVYTTYFKDNTDVRCTLYTRLLFLYQSDHPPHKFLEVEAEYRNYLDQNPHLKFIEEKWLLSRLIGFYTNNLSLNPPSSFFKEIDEAITETVKEVDKSYRNGLIYSLTIFYFVRKKYNDALETIYKVVLIEKIKENDPSYMDAYLVEVFCNYELGNTQLAKNKLVSLKRKVNHNQLIDPFYKTGINLILKYLNAFEDQTKQTKSLEQLRELINNQSGSTASMLEGHVIKFWVTDKLKALQGKEVLEYKPC